MIVLSLILVLLSGTCCHFVLEMLQLLMHSSLLGIPVSSTSENQISSFPFVLRMRVSAHTCVCVVVVVVVVVVVAPIPLFVLFSVGHLEHLRIGTVETTVVIMIIKILGSFSLGKPAATEPTD